MIKVKEDLCGRIFGRLIVKEQTEDYVGPSGKKASRWLVQCSCGSDPFSVLQSSLKTGNTTSCGCVRLENALASNTKHGMHGSAEYTSWCKMTQRCFNKNHKHYKYYGGRGITVCDRWIGSFENFYEDMGECPSGYSLDRIDVNGNYEPENCKWSDRSEQGYNQRKRSTNTSGRTGVSWDSQRGKWAAQIVKDGRNRHLGRFDTFEEAAAAREAAELEIYGYNKQ